MRREMTTGTTRYQPNHKNTNYTENTPTNSTRNYAMHRIVPICGLFVPSQIGCVGDFIDFIIVVFLLQILNRHKRM